MQAETIAEIQAARAKSDPDDPVMFLAAQIAAVTNEYVREMRRVHGDDASKWPAIVV